MSDHEFNNEAYTSDLITYTTRGDTHQSATLTATEGCDFLDFLGIAQTLKIDFLPLTWQPALDSVGEGGTAKIRQALVNIRLAFAFKHLMRPRSNTEEIRNWRALKAEIFILGHPAIRQHPSVVNIEGICWDVADGGEKVWPVLVFEKTGYGDLKRFMTEGAGKELSIKARLDILFDVAYAVRDLHAYGVIHGDIKPENILVFCEDERYVAKVTDFGYSTMFARDSDGIIMPYSKQWTAPEHHHREFTPTQARKMDVYSFGILCLWLLFGRMMTDHDGNTKEDLEISENILEYNPGLIEGSLHRSDEVDNLFKLSLSKDPAQRTADFSKFLELISFYRFQALAPPLNKLFISPKGFQVSQSIPQLLDAHYSLRPYITKCLEERHNRSSTDNNDVLNLAVCYELGFGAQRETMKGRKFLKGAEIPIKALEDLIEQLKMDLQPSEFYDGRFRELFEHRQALELDYSHQYREEQRVAEAETRYQQEIEALGSVLGADHHLVQKLRLQLFLLLSNEERWKDAENILFPMVDIGRQRTHEGLNTGRLIPYLAATYRNQGRLKEAEELDIEIIQINEKVWGAQHPQTLISKSGLASTYINQGRLKEAEELELEVVETGEKVLGTEHEITMVSLGNLVSTYFYQERWKDAEQLASRVVEINKRALGAEHPQTLTNMTYLASIYRKQERLKEAEETGKRVLETSKRVLGWEHPHTLNRIANLAKTYWAQGRWREAEELEVQVMEMSKNVLGEEHQDTLRSITNLQWYQDARCEESEKVSRSWIANVWRRGKERLHRE